MFVCRIESLTILSSHGEFCLPPARSIDAEAPKQECFASCSAGKLFAFRPPSR